MIETVWPPTYTLRRSGKARNTFLQISPKRGLEVVVPVKLRRLNVEQILQEKRGWIEKMLGRMDKPVLTPDTNTIALPTELDLKAFEEKWQIIYQSVSSDRITLKMHSLEKTLILKGNIQDIILCKKALIKWLVKFSKTHLIIWLQNLSNLTGFKYNRVSIRGQTTLWGSCTAKKNISLNYKLLFFPQSLAKHVLLHELCHTKYLNHSIQFWHLLKSWDPNFKENKQSLKTGERFLPIWLQSE